jgi:hypothetical protein
MGYGVKGEKKKRIRFMGRIVGFNQIKISIKRFFLRKYKKREMISV